MADASKVEQQPRRWGQYSLRTSVIVVALLSCLLAYWTEYARRNRAAIKSVQESGGEVEYWHNVVDTDPQYFSVTYGKPPMVPEWLWESLGDEWFVSIVGVNFNRAITDDDLKPLLDLTELWWVRGDFTNVTDEGVTVLGRLRSLRFLRITDNTLITDEGLGSLAELKELWELDLAYTRISTQGLRKMRIQEMQHLRELIITEANIDDEGVVLLASLPELELLFLDHNPVTDASIEQFCRMKNLYFLSLMGTRVSDAGVARLRQARPDLQLTGP